MNGFSSLRPEFYVWLKVEYRSSSWQRMLEVMSITHFFFGPHTTFIMSSHIDSINTRMDMGPDRRLYRIF